MKPDLLSNSSLLAAENADLRQQVTLFKAHTGSLTTRLTAAERSLGDVYNVNKLLQAELSDARDALKLRTMQLIASTSALVGALTWLVLRGPLW